MSNRSCRMLVRFAAGALLAVAPAFAQADAGGAVQPDGPRVEAPADAAAFFARVRAAYSGAPVTERLRISVRRREGAVRRSLLLVRTEPAPDRSGIQRVIIRAGRLLIDAQSASESVHGFVRAAMDASVGPIFESPAEDLSAGAALARALPPLPIAQLDLVGVGNVPESVAAYARGITWDNLPTLARAGEIQLNGRFENGAVTVIVDRSTWRLRRVQIELGEAGSGPGGGGEGANVGTTIVIEHAPSSARLVGIETVSRDGSPRQRVATPSALMAGMPATAVGTVLELEPAPDAGELLRSAMRDAANQPRPAIVLLLGTPAATHENAARAMAALAAELGSGPESAIAGLVVAWAESGDENQAWRQWIATRPDAASIFSGPCSRGGEELARIAPGATGAFIAIAPDLEILAVHPLEQLSADPEQQVAELLMSLLDAVHASRTPAEQDPR